jgi:hypothetical protein
MEEQIREQMTNAFWDLVDQEPPNAEHIGKLLEEIKHRLYGLVPSRVALHHTINDDLPSDDIQWDLQERLLEWILRLQSPIHDQTIRSWKKRVPEKLSDFIRKYHEHLDVIYKDIDTYKNPPKVTGKNGVPDNLRTGR